MRTVKFGVIGCGLMGREFASASARWMHLNDMRVRPEIIAVCDSNESMMAWFSKHVSTVSQCSTNYQDLLNNPEIEAIYCAVPHVLHEQLYPDIIKAGKHLLGEKPFGMNLSQNSTILSHVHDSPELLVRCSSEMPFFPGAQKVINLAKSGQMGDILEVECCFLHSSDINPDKTINWKRMEALNGDYGCMGDLGMHVLHIPLRLGWRPHRLSASLINAVRERPDGEGKTVPCDTWDNATITGYVENSDHSFPLVMKTWRIAPGESNTWSIRILGMKQSAFFTTKNPRQWQWMDYKPGGDQAWQVQDLGYQSVFPAITGGIFEFGFTDAIQQMWAAYLDEMNGGNANGFHCATPTEAAAHHAILNAALIAGRERSMIDVNYMDEPA